VDKKICLLIPLLVCFCSLEAQYVDYGEDPAYLKWRQIKTPHYRIIYPEGNDIRANTYANILETVYPHVRKTMSAKRSSVVPVILHPYNVNSNGMVSWAPKRMELLPSPNFDSRFQLPESGLSVHESRHVVQMEKQNSGIFRPLYFIFGEQTAGVSSALIPQWLLEGEAVVAETALSSSGRGRLASFLMPYRAQIATGKNFSLDKWFLGSYRDCTHDFYALGYAMSAHARISYGADVWDRVLGDMTLYLFHPVALKKNTGLSPRKLFKSTFASLQEEWDSLTPEKPDELTVISPKRRRYTSYRYPLEVEGGIISLKMSLSDIPAIVLIDSSGRERRLTYTGTINSKPTLDGNFVYWTEYIPGLRWRHENYSIVKQLNIKTREVKTVSKRSRYFTPAVSSGEILAFEHEPNGQNNIVAMNLSGEKLHSYPVIDNMPVQDMVADGNENIFASLTGNGNAVFKLDLNTSEWKKISNCNRTNLESLRMHGEQLIFESGYNGVNNIYALDTASLSVKRLTNSVYGASAGTFSRDGSKLYLSDYSAKGHRIAGIETTLLNEEPVNFDSPYKFRTAENLSAQESFNIDEYKFDDTVAYKSEPYKKAAHLFNIHSWVPFHFDLDELMNSYEFGFNAVKPGIMLLSQNRLNTLTSQVSSYYDLNTKDLHGFLSLRYSGWFPVFTLKLNVGGRRDYLFYDYSYEETSDPNDFENQRHVEATLSAYLPFNFTKGYYLHGLQPFFNYKYLNSIINGTNQNYRYFYTGIYHYRYRSLAHNDIFPKLGWQAWLSYVGHPYISMGQLLIAKANIYVPGIFRNHGLRVSGSVQHQFVSKNTTYYFPEQYVDIARGYSYYTSEHTGGATERLYTLKGDYSFPIVYPDFKMGSIIYLSRIRANLFYDMTINNVKYAVNNYTVTGVVTQKSYGFDLMFDLHFFRMKYAPVTLMINKTKIPGRDFINTLSIGINL
jgi:hypothetical protein